MALFFLCFAGSRMVYLILEDDYFGYNYQVNYPILSRSVELITADVVEYTNPFFDIIPKNRYEVSQIMPRLKELIFQK